MGKSLGPSPLRRVLAQLCLAGNDPFGGQTFIRPWVDDTMEAARLKADVAFEMFPAACRLCS